MNENNLEYLKKTLDGLGFGAKLNEVLENAIRREMPSFSLGITTLQKPLENPDRNAAKTEHLSFKFNFNRSKDSDMYFLNNYNVALYQKGNPIVREQTFDLERDYRVTALQAYKLLSGLSFEKEVYLRSRMEEGRHRIVLKRKHRSGSSSTLMSPMHMATIHFVPSVRNMALTLLRHSANIRSRDSIHRKS